MSCFSCFASRRKDVRRVEIDNGSRSAAKSGSYSLLFLLIFHYIISILNVAVWILQGMEEQTLQVLIRVFK